MAKSFGRLLSSTARQLPPSGLLFRRGASGSSQRQSMGAAMSADYAEWSAVQRGVFPTVSEALRRGALEAAASSTGGCFHLADLGCSTGSSSLAPLQLVRSVVKGDKPMQVFMVDQPTNPWSEVFRCTESYSAELPDIYFSAVARSFYDVSVAPGLLDFSYCLVAMHWMKRRPCPLLTGLYATCPTHVTDPGELAQWKDAARMDLDDFFAARAAELRPGGIFVANVLSYLPSGVGCWTAAALVWWQSLERAAAAAGTSLTDQERSRITMPCSYRTREEVLASTQLAHNGGPLRLEALEEVASIPCPHFRQYELDQDREAFARGVLGSFYAVVEPSVREGLAETRDAAMVERLLRHSGELAMAEWASDPEQYQLTTAFRNIILRKEP